MISLTYLGGHDSVDVKLPSRWLFGIANGETVEVTEEEAERLLQLTGWDSAPMSHPEEDEQ